MNKRVTNSWFVQKLIEMGACREAVRYALKHRTFPAAWRECDDLDWVAWLLRKFFTLEHGDWCAFCFNESEAQLLARLHRRFPADRVAKALRKWKA